MGEYEIIDRLCGITNELSDIVKKQAEIIAQCEISDAVAAELKEMRDKADEALDIAEYRLRRR